MPVKSGKSRKHRHARIKFREKARLVAKKDATNVARPDTTRRRYAPTPTPHDNGAVFKIKIRRR